ncbi:hypothetical protein JMJ35_002285 [Cladonia borealis]|uniref:Smr domain-containing protein n=1 Tax=Cladonia borealis TaxID=184061 RepID=A0AA39R6C4_9LECA|nr:hypothetical protein JMJ35_002285 [Cladonia borealis]
MDDIRLLLEKEYCPPIDSSTFFAIVNDYSDLSDTISVEELKATLDLLKEDALTQDNATFDPSGTSGSRDDISSHDSSERAQSWHGDNTSAVTDNTEFSALSQATGEVDLGRELDGVDSFSETDLAELQALTPSQKARLLKEMFHGATDFDTIYILRKVDNDFEKAVDELLNQAYFKDEDLKNGESNLKKGIEAFTEPAVGTQGRRGRRKKKQPQRRTSSTPVSLIPQYLPRAISPNPPDMDIASSNSTTPLQLPRASALLVARSNAFAQAQAAHRKSKSIPLMGGAASYYSSVARDAHATLRQHDSARANELVARQSRPGEVDLHGVSVSDATRIAKVEVEQWWEREGREWSREGKVMVGGLRIITGIGRHSDGGRGKLGPAVRAMLKREDWKIEEGEGVFEVVGRVRR